MILRSSPVLDLPVVPADGRLGSLLLFLFLHSLAGPGLCSFLCVPLQHLEQYTDLTFW